MFRAAVPYYSATESSIRSSLSNKMPVYYTEHQNILLFNPASAAYPSFGAGMEVACSQAKNEKTSCLLTKVGSMRIGSIVGLL